MKLLLKTICNALSTLSLQRFHKVWKYYFYHHVNFGINFDPKNSRCSWHKWGFEDCRESQDIWLEAEGKTSIWCEYVEQIVVADFIVSPKLLFFQYQVCYGEYLDSQGVLNSSLAFSNQHPEFQIMLLEAAFYTESYAICRTLLEVCNILLFYRMNCCEAVSFQLLSAIFAAHSSTRSILHSCKTYFSTPRFLWEQINKWQRPTQI